MNIEYWRTEIDEVDRELLQLLNRRARLAMKVGTLKRAAGLPFCDPEREQVVLQTLQQANTGPLDPRAIAKVFRRIIRESRRVEAQAIEQVVNGERGGDKLKFVGRPSTSREALL
jgi:chorismate mutase-like protein